MEIQLAPHENHSIRSYSDHSVTIQGETYTESMCISRQHIQTQWGVTALDSLTSTALEPLLQDAPEIILIGHTTQQTPPHTIRIVLSRQHIGLEWMSIGAACRTFNILLAENRKVALGIIFPV